MRGVVLKGIAGFYYVLAGGEIYECKPRGIFRKDGVSPLAGDKVEISLQEDGSGIIEEILPRMNSFSRPPVANVETMIVVSSGNHPEPNFPLMDRLTVMAEKADCEIAICATKEDISDERVMQRFRNVYSPIYPVFVLSAVTGKGMEDFREFLKGKQAALAGASGVGKSTLLNTLIGEERSETGEISRKTLRGRHTTRHSELFDCGDFKLFDTPGFTSFDLEGIEEAELGQLFPEFAPYIADCYFNDCRHLSEPGCAVLAALSERKISRRRYASYEGMIDFIRSIQKY